jgi:hypothetical protein
MSRQVNEQAGRQAIGKEVWQADSTKVTLTGRQAGREWAGWQEAIRAARCQCSKHFRVITYGRNKKVTSHASTLHGSMHAVDITDYHAVGVFCGRKIFYIKLATGWQKGRQADRQTVRQIDKQKSRQAARQMGRQTGRQGGKEIQVGRQAGMLSG